MTQASILLKDTTICPFKWVKNRFYCFYCDQRCLDPQILRAHNSTEHKFSSLSEIKEYLTKLRKHELVKVDVTNLSCLICNFTVDNLGNMKLHLKDVHNRNVDVNKSDGVLPFKLTNKDFKCVICEQAFVEFKVLNHHMNLHYQNFICELCGAGFVTPERLRTHTFSHQSGNFPCEICHRVYRSANAKNEHFATVHQKVKRHYCPHCNECFRNYFQRNKHVSSVHGVKLKEFKCTMCPKTFTLSGKLSVHIKRVHLKVKRFPCDKCDWKFFSKSELKDHKVKHDGEKKYNCEMCKKSYARKYTLTEHMRIHENDRRFECRICGRAFVQNSSLKQHVKVHHPEPDDEFKTVIRTDSTRRIVPLFQVAYDRSLGKPISAMDTKKLRLPSSFIPQKPKPKPREREPSISRSPSPIDYSFDNETDEKAVEKSTKKTRRNYFDVRQNAVTLFEFSTVYPFIYGNNTFKCYICSSAFLETLPLRQHMKEAHTFPAIKRLIHNRRVDMMKVDVGEITCKICLHTLKSLPDLKHHLKEHGKKIDPDLQDNMIPLNLECVNGTYKCVVCEQLFVKIRNLIIHMSEHFNNYSCEICGSGFMTLRLLRKHLEVHEIGNFPCDKCDKSFNTPQKLSIHNRGVHLKLNPRRCPICPERFNSNYRRTIHMQDVHNMSTRVYKCETCGRGFNLKYHMVCHVRSVHLQERNQQCDVCHQRFCNKETLKRHMIVHTGEKKYKCQFCGMAFLRRKNLKDHLRLHEIGT